MLILSRRAGETILISTPGSDEQIKVTVLGLKGNQVRIGTDAPKNMSILRAELLESDTA